MPAHALSERAARAALAAHFAPGQLAAELDEYTPAEVWQRRVRGDGSGRLAHYRPHEELAQAELTCPFVLPSDEEWPTALADLGPACPLGLWVRGRERLPRLSGTAVVVTGNRVPTERAVTCAHDFAAALAEAGHTVTATLAYGVDSTAHQAAAETGAASLAVLPRGLDGAHPHAHASLLRSVLDGGGAAVSLYRPGTVASGATLKASAAVLAALARAVILVEAWTTSRRCTRPRRPLTSAGPCSPCPARGASAPVATPDSSTGSSPCIVPIPVWCSLCRTRA
ncbi:DNA-processing protein DprA [Streptomyces sp. NPDC006476]|uniref:DNA-processing protein DprA n=1 Tax=Streptomyces sp. NPDC006476 TaxID=3157175 RepID=UPI0033B4C7DC